MENYFGEKEPRYGEIIRKVDALEEGLRHRVEEGGGGNFDTARLKRAFPSEVTMVERALEGKMSND